MRRLRFTARRAGCVYRTVEVGIVGADAVPRRAAAPFTQYLLGGIPGSWRQRMECFQAIGPVAWHQEPAPRLIDGFGS